MQSRGSSTRRLQQLRQARATVVVPGLSGPGACGIVLIRDQTRLLHRQVDP